MDLHGRMLRLPYRPKQIGYWENALADSEFLMPDAQAQEADAVEATIESGELDSSIEDRERLPGYCEGQKLMEAVYTEKHQKGQGSGRNRDDEDSEKTKDNRHRQNHTKDQAGSEAADA
ncbi:MAG: hypothetical protein WKG07_01215 [Hymenobacter sp.]